MNRSEIEGRLDPISFHSERRETIAKLSNSRKIIRLINAVKSRKSVVTQSDNPYIGLENIQSHTGEYIESQEKETFSSANIFQAGDILFSKLRPYLNKVYLAEFDGICSTEFHIFNGNQNYLNEFLAIYLRSNLIVNQTKYLMTGNTLPRLQTEDIYNLPVPILSKDEQIEIVKKYNQAMLERKNKLTQSQTLLNSISDYLLEKLGITVPQVDNSLTKRTFLMAFNQLDNRFDPEFYFHRKNKITDGKFKNVLLEEIANLIKGTSLSSKNVIDGDYPVIAGGQTSPYNHHTYNFDGETITVSASGAYAGFVAYHNYPIFASDCTVVKSTDNNTALTQYIFEILKLKQNEIYHLRKGAVQPHVYATDLAKIKIPLPDLPTQKTIVAHINQIRKQAQNLEQQAKDLLQQTQQEIEKIILGN